MNGFKKPDQIAPEDMDLAAHIHTELGCKDPLTLKFIHAVLVAVRIFDYKQQRYGPNNIAAFGEKGVLVRLHDKLARLIHLDKTGQEPQDETRDDSWGDTAVYAVIALMCRWGWWPGVAGAAARKPE